MPKGRKLVIFTFQFKGDISWISGTEGFVRCREYGNPANLVTPSELEVGSWAIIIDDPKGSLWDLLPASILNRDFKGSDAMAILEVVWSKKEAIKEIYCGRLWKNTGDLSTYIHEIKNIPLQIFRITAW